MDIIELLNKGDAMDFFLRLLKSIANDITEQINQPYKTVTGHIKNLERTGLLKPEHCKGNILNTINISDNPKYNNHLFTILKRE